MHPCVRSLMAIVAVLFFNACGSDASKPASTATPPPSTSAATRPATASSGTDAEFGAAECDTYVKQYLACIDRMPGAAQSQARQALEQTRTAWKQAAATEQGKAALAMTCKAASDASAPAMRAYGCEW